MLKNASWLKKNIKKKNIKIIDASWYLPNTGRNAYKEYLKHHIEKAVFFDIDKISNTNNKLPHMLPNKKKFEYEISRIGINNKDILIIYCKEGVLSSPRVWWTFKYFGHKNVFVLDGGLDAWKRAGGLITKKIRKISKTFYKIKTLQKSLLINYNNLKNQLKNNEKNILVLDARPRERFLQLIAEPRENIGKGIIPGSKNFTFSLFDYKGHFKNKTNLRSIFRRIPENKKLLVCSCGSGVAACNIAISLELIGKKNWTIYDGSWTEWYLKLNSNL